MAVDQQQITRILRREGDTPDSEALLQAVYDQLHAVAQQRMRAERKDHTLNATALVHEAFLRLSASSEQLWQSRAHYFAAAAEAMRRILIDHARRRGAQKRGHRQRLLPVDVADLAAEGCEEDVLDLEQALATLAAEDARAADVVRLRFYAGLEVDEVGETLGISARTAAREWSFARARLFQLLSESGAGPAPH